MNKPKSTRQQQDLGELCALFIAADEWGQGRIMEAARRQAPVAALLPATSLALVAASPVLNQRPHRLDNPVYFRPLALVRQPVHAKKS